MDLDGFKAVNDHHGHAAGDHVLRAAATRIKALAPAGSEWARVGGDEFVLVVDRMDSIEAATALAEAVVNAFRRPIGITGLLTPVGASVGVAVGEPGVTTSSLLDSADRALLAAKAAGQAVGAWPRTGPTTSRHPLTPRLTILLSTGDPPVAIDDVDWTDSQKRSILTNVTSLYDLCCLSASIRKPLR